MTIFQQDIHNEYIDSDGQVIWGFNELDMGDDANGMDDWVVARCAQCDGQIFVAWHDGDDMAPVWGHVSPFMDCDHATPAW